MLYQALRFPKKLKQPLLLDEQQSVPDYCRLAYKCFEGWDASREYVFSRGCDDTEHTSYPNPKKLEALLCLLGLSRKYYLGDEVYPTFFHDDDRDMDLFSLIRAPNPTKVKTGSRPRAAHEVPLLTVTANRSTEPEDQEAVAPEVPPLENVTTTGVAPEAGQAERVAATGPLWSENATREATMGSTQMHPLKSSKGAAAAGDPESENTSFTSMVGSLESIYRPEWGITNGYLLDAPEACQDLVDHIAPPGYFLKVRHLHNDDFLKQYNVNLARQVVMGLQLRLRFKQEAKLLKKSVAQVAHRDKRIQARENEIKNLETLLEAETDMKKAAKNKSVHSPRAAIAGRRWVIKHGLHLAVMKCDESTELRQAFTDVVPAWIAKGMSEGLKHEVKHEKAKLDLEAIEAYDPKAEAKYIAALHALKNLKYSLVDQLESLKDAPMDVIIASLHLESDTEDDASRWIRELRPSSSQLTIPVYPEARDPMDPWACKSDGVAVSVPTVAPQGLAILLTDSATQTKTSEDEASLRLLRSSSLPIMHS
nr:hypothetical protein [Tanacetum cinerariifolium]